MLTAKIWWVFVLGKVVRNFTHGMVQSDHLNIFAAMLLSFRNPKVIRKLPIPSFGKEIVSIKISGVT